MKELYSIRKLNKCNISGLNKVSGILYACGRNMANEFNLHHWDNSRIKNCIIVALCNLKNDIYLVYCNEKPVATFQTRKIKKVFLFQKLATYPQFAGGGVGSACLAEIERLAKESACAEVICEVYDKSMYAINFYLHRGYTICGTTDTLKYRELKMRKVI